MAKRDAPKVAEQCWTHGFPAGPKGRFAPFLPYFWGIWNFGKNKSAAKSLLVHLSQPARSRRWWRERRLRPAVVRQADHAQDLGRGGPPKGTLYHYPNPHNHQTLSIAAAPAPPKIALQIYTQAIQTKMIVRHLQGEPWTRRSPGPRARSKASCAPEVRRRLSAGAFAEASG